MVNSARILYRAPWRTGSFHPGSHAGDQRGPGHEVSGRVPFHSSGDPRRLDLHASLRDPLRRILLRVYHQRSIVPVHVLADVSASMSFVGRTCKMDLLGEFVDALGTAACGLGDPFAFTACDTTVRVELSLPSTLSPGAGPYVARRLRRSQPTGSGAAGLLAGTGQVGRRRALVFLVSDYYLPIDLVRAVIANLYRHAVVPVVLVDSAEYSVPGTGFVRLYDPETGTRRLLLLRRSLARRLERNLRDHHEQLRRCLADFDLKPLYIVDRFDADAVSRYFRD